MPKRSIIILASALYWLTHALNVNGMHIISTLKERHSTAIEFVKLQQLAWYVRTLLYNRHKTAILTCYLYNIQTELILVNKDVKGRSELLKTQSVSRSVESTRTKNNLGS